MALPVTTATEVDASWMAVSTQTQKGRTACRYGTGPPAVRAPEIWALNRGTGGGGPGAMDGQITSELGDGVGGGASGVWIFSIVDILKQYLMMDC